MQSVDASIAVSIQQSVLDGSVTSSNMDGSASKSVPAGNSSYSSDSMISHRGVTYVALGTADGSGPSPTLRVYTGPQIGSWHTISTERSNQSISVDVFKVWLDLGASPIANGSAAYAILPGSSAPQAAATLKRVDIIANDADRQVVAYKQNSTATTMAVVFKAGEVFSERSKMGYSLACNDSLIFTFTKTLKGVNFAFSRPMGGTRVVRLSIPLGKLGSFKGLTTSNESAYVTCSMSNGTQRVDLLLPEAPGRTATGSCMGTT